MTPIYFFLYALITFLIALFIPGKTKILKSARFIFFIIGLIMLFFSFWYPQIFAPKIEAGQVWVHEYNKDNPFKEIKRDTAIVLDVKYDYVKYVEGKDTNSCSSDWFILCAKQIK